MGEICRCRGKNDLFCPCAKRLLPPYHLPQHDADGNGDIEGVLGAVLGDFQRYVADIDDVLADAGDFIAEDEGVFARRVAAEGAEFLRMDGLFHGDEGVTLRAQKSHGVQRVIEMFPRDGILGAEGRFVDLGGGRDGGDTAEKDFVDAEGIGRAEGAADIVRAADVVQYHDKAGRGKVLILSGRDAAQLDIQQFSVLHPRKVKKKTIIFVSATNAIMKQDLQVFDLIKKEKERQASGLELIASENYVSDQVMAAMGSICTNKYAEGYPGKRYYGGCEVVDQIEQVAIDRLCKLYDAEYANVQPHSGAQANMAVIMACLRPGDVFMGLDLSMGGHLTHGSPVNASGILYKPVAYGLNPETGLVDYDEMERKALEYKPKLIIGGASAYSREWDYERMRKIADEVGALLWIDMAHTAGLIAAGLLKNPVKYAHIVTSTTHKTLRGPRGGIILMGKDFDNPWGLTTPKGEIKKMSAILNSSVFPGVQGGPLEHVIAAKAVAFYEAAQPEYISYQKQVIANAATMCAEFIRRGYKIISGGTDNHLMLIDLRTKFPDLTGRVAETQLVKADITVNKNMVPFDSRSPFQTSGLRIGTPAITSRGFVEKDMLDIVELIDTVLASSNEHFAALTAKEPTEEQLAERAAHEKVLKDVVRKVNMMTAGRPLNRY